MGLEHIYQSDHETRCRLSHIQVGESLESLAGLQVEGGNVGAAAHGSPKEMATVNHGKLLKRCRRVNWVERKIRVSIVIINYHFFTRLSPTLNMNDRMIAFSVGFHSLYWGDDPKTLYRTNDPYLPTIVFFGEHPRPRSNSWVIWIISGHANSSECSPRLGRKKWMLIPSLSVRSNVESGTITRSIL